MANNLTNTWETRSLDWLNPNVALPTRPTAPLRVVLYTAMPNQETGAGGTEMTGLAYARQVIVFDAASDSATSNSDDVVFPTATGGTWNIVGMAVIENGGSLMWITPFAQEKTVPDGQAFILPAGSVTLSQD